MSTNDAPKIFLAAIEALNVFTRCIADRKATLISKCLRAAAAVVVIAATASYSTPLASGDPFSQSASRRLASIAKAASPDAAPQEIEGAASPVITYGELKIERRNHTATPLASGAILIVGGENHAGPVRRSEVFEPATRIASLAAGLNIPRADHTATALADGRVLIAGGRNRQRVLRSTELYDPATNSFSRGPSLRRGRAGHSATTLADGRVLIVGGDDKGSAEIFDPAARSLVLIEAGLSVARSLHSAVLLQSEKVLIAGGRHIEGGAALLAELFDAEAMRFSPARNTMRGERLRPTLRLLPDGKVQVIGGDTQPSMEMFNAEGEYFTAYARLLGGADFVAELLRAQTRAAFIRAMSDQGSMQASKPSRAFSDLLDRSDYSLTDAVDSSEAIIAGGATGSGRVLKSAVIVSSSPASVTTDKTDYSPGEAVIISGSGWQPGEIVRMTLHRDNPLPDTLLEAEADSNGRFENSEYIVQESDADVAFLLTAIGLSSGRAAQTAFTDSVSALSITSPTTAIPVNVTSLPADVTIAFTYRTSPTLPTTGEASLESGAGVIATSGSQALASGGAVGSPLSGALTVTIPAGAANGSYTVKLILANGTGATGTATRTQSNAVTICAKPSITDNPLSQSKCEGESATLAVFVSSTTAASYQWRKNGSEIIGATDSALTISHTCADDAGLYDVVVTNSCGSVTSSTASLTINPRPTATVTGSATICASESASISVTLTGDGPWSITWSDGVAQSATSSPAIRVVSPASTTVYSVTSVSDAHCAADSYAISGSAIVTVGSPPVVTLGPADQIAFVGEGIIFAAAAEGMPSPAVQWQVNAGGGFEDIPGAESAMLTIASVSLAQSGNLYRAVFFNSCSVEGVASGAARLIARYSFNGFFRPVENPNTVNTVKAGSAVPVKFSLSGYQGMNIFAAGYPKSEAMTCASTAPTQEVGSDATAEFNSFSYDAAADQYLYVWKTNKAWAGTCRQLIVKLSDGASHFAIFSFKR